MDSFQKLLYYIAQPRRTTLIDYDLVPIEIRGMVVEATENYDDRRWRGIIANWDIFFQELVRFARKMGEEHRRECLRDRSGVFQELAKSEDMELAMAIFCLSDEVLDKIIANLPKRQ